MVWQAGASMIHRGCKQHLVAGKLARKTKTPPSRRKAAFCLIVTRKEELLCLWQAWQ